MKQRRAKLEYLIEKAANPSRDKYRGVVTADDYDRIVVSQNGTCGICKSKRGFNEKRYPVDHDPVTHEVRGLLCHKCNTAIGLLDNNPDTIAAALEYLGNPPMKLFGLKLSATTIKLIEQKKLDRRNKSSGLIRVSEPDKQNEEQPPKLIVWGLTACVCP